MGAGGRKRMVSWMLTSMSGLLAAAVLVTAGPSTSAGGAEPSTPLLTIGDFRHSVSPNGDGFHDRFEVPITMAEGGWVRATVVGTDTGIAIRNLGCLLSIGGCGYGQGDHVITWDDLKPDLHNWVAPPSGTYRVVLSARPDGDPTMRRQTSFTFTYLADSIIVDQPGHYDDRAFSPDGDGVLDRTDVPFLLERRSRVVAIVTSAYGEDLPRYRVRAGVRRAGDNTWRWDGRVAGRVLPDDHYSVTLRATPVRARPEMVDRARAEATLSLILDTTAPNPQLRMNRSTVYPSATTISDSLRIGLVADPEDVTAAVLRPNGKRLARLRPTWHECYWSSGHESLPCTLLTWYAKTPSGPVHAGTYRLRVTVGEAAGNTTTIGRVITVSADQLVEQTGTVTWSATDAPLAGDYCGSGCHSDEYWCYPRSTPSERFPGGQSFRSNPEECQSNIKPGVATHSYGFTPDLPSGGTRYDRFRVTASGGPTTAGASDVLTLGSSTGPSDQPVRVSTTLSGDTSATTEWAPVRPDVELFSDDYGEGSLPRSTAHERMRWDVSTRDSNRYDIASYTLEYSYYVPSP